MFSHTGVAIGAYPEPQNSHAPTVSSYHVAGSTAFVSPLSGCGNDLRGNLTPIKGFVHEVLCHSRTSGCILQTALCYLETIRPKMSDLIQKEQAIAGICGEPNTSSHIIPAIELANQINPTPIKSSSPLAHSSWGPSGVQLSPLLPPQTLRCNS